MLSIGSRRFLSASLIAVAVTVPMAGAARPATVPAPAPSTLQPLRAASCADLSARHAAVRADIGAAERMAASHGDSRRAAALRAMAEPARRFLWFDGRDGGRAAEVFGDLCGAERIAVLVPGSDTDLERYERLRAGATALWREAGDRTAVVAWLGYRTPGTPSLAVATQGRADAAARALRAFVGDLPTARVVLVCHSYGGVVCAKAAAGLAVSDIVLYGSPGTGFADVSEMDTTATVWAGRAAADWIERVPNVELRLPSVDVGFGTDPVSPEFGARVFPAGDGGHSDYLAPGSVPLRAIADIVVGRHEH